MKTSIRPNYSSVDVFRLLVDDKMIDYNVCETNKYTDQKRMSLKRILKLSLSAAR